MCVCVCVLTLNCEFQWKAIWFVQGPVCHHTVYVFAVVFWFGDHAVLTANGHSVVSIELRHLCSIAIGCGHPFDLGSRAAVDRITARHNNLASASFHRHNGC